MAVINLCGFETASSAEFLSNSGTPVYSTSTVRSGNRSLQSGPSTGGIAVTLGTFSATGVQQLATWSTIYARFYVYFESLPSSGSFNPLIFQLIDQAGTQGVLDIQLHPTTHKLVIPGVATGSTTLLTGQWYRIEVKATHGASQSVEVRIDGEVELLVTMNVSNGVTPSTSIGSVKVGKFGSSTDQAVTWYFDDILLKDDAFPGEGKIVRLDPNANGNYTAWGVGAGSASGDYTDVDDLNASTIDDDTTYVRTTTLNNRESSALESASDVGINSGDTINAVKAFAVVRDESTTCNWSLFLRDSTDFAQTTSADGSNTYGMRSVIRSTNSSNASFSISDINSLEVGVQHNQSQARALRCTSMGVMVEYNPLVTRIKNQQGLARVTQTGVQKNEQGTSRVIIRNRLLDGLVSHWRLDETTSTNNDSHGTNHLTSSGTSSTTGKIGSALLFNTVSDSNASISDNNSLSLSSYRTATFSLWVYPNSSNASQYVFYKGFNNTEYYLHFDGSTLTFTWAVRQSDNNYASVTKTVSALNTWYFIVVWCDLSTNNIYIQIDNGTASSASITDFDSDTTGAFTLGRATNSRYGGRIDSLSFWYRVLADSERTLLYNSTNGLDYSGFLLSAPLNQQGKAAIIFRNSSFQSGRSRIHTTVSKTNSGTARIRNTYAKNQNSLTYINVKGRKVLSNFPASNNNSSLTVHSGRPAAIKFTTGNTAEIINGVLLVNTLLGNSQVIARFFNDGGSEPGSTQIGSDLTGVVTSAADYRNTWCPAPSPITLAANTTYWMVVTSNNTSGFLWAISSSDSPYSRTPTGTATYVAAYSNVSGWATIANSPTFDLRADTQPGFQSGVARIKTPSNSYAVQESYRRYVDFRDGATLSNDSITKGIIGAWLINEGFGTKVFDLRELNHSTLESTDGGAPLWTRNKFGIYVSPLTYFTIPSNASKFTSFTNRAKSFSFWFSTSSLSGTDTIITKNGAWSVSINAGQLRFIHNGTVVNQFSNSSQTLEINKFYHVVVTVPPFGAGASRIFINGRESTYSSTGVGNGPLDDSSINLTVGHTSGAVQYSFSNVIIFDRILSRSEIRLLYSQPYSHVSKRRTESVVKLGVRSLFQSGVASIVSSGTRVYQNQAGIARIQATSRKNQTGVARVQKTSNLYQSGVARLQKSSSLYQSGVSRITNTARLNQQSIGRITATAHKFQTGVARIQKSETTYLSGVSRISNTVSKYQSGVARIAATNNSFVSGISRIQNTGRVFQNGLARITRVNLLSQSATSRITNTVLRSQSGVARITTTATLNGSATSRIQKTGVVFQSGVARITNSGTKFQDGIARISKIVNLNQSAISRIQKTGVVYQLAVARITNVVTKFQSGVARVTKTVGLNQLAVSRIQNTGVVYQPAVAKITNSATKFQSGIARITTSGTKYQSGTARVQKSATVYQSAIARVQTTQTINQSGVSRITTSSTKNQGGLSRITNTGQVSQSAVSRITAVSVKYQSGISRITQIRSTFQSGISRVTVSTTKSQSGTARITVSSSKYQFSISRVTNTARVYQDGIARITATATKYQDGVSRITSAATKYQTGQSRIQKTTTVNLNGISRVTKSETKFISGVARIIATSLKSQSGTTRIQNTNSLNQNGTAAIRKGADTYQSGVARIKNTYSQSQTGVAQIRRTEVKYQTSVSRITYTNSIYGTGITRITNTALKSNSGVARITNTASKFQLGTARVQRTESNYQSGTARITKTATINVQGVARIVNTASKYQSGAARIQNSYSVYQPGVSRIQRTSAIYQNGIARITTSNATYQNGVARIAKTQSLTLNGVARINAAGFDTANVYQNGQARISNTYNTSQAGTARISRTTNQNQLGIARVQKSNSLFQNGATRIQKTQSFAQQAISRVQNTGIAHQSGVSRIKVVGDKYQSGISRIVKSGTLYQNGVSRIQNSSTLNENGTARIQTTRSLSNSGTARIQTSATLSTQGLGRIRATVNKYQTGVARINATDTRSTSQTGISRIQKTSALFIGGTARISDPNERVYAVVITFEPVKSRNNTKITKDDGRTRVASVTNPKTSVTIVSPENRAENSLSNRTSVRVIR